MRQGLTQPAPPVPARPDSAPLVRLDPADRLGLGLGGQTGLTDLSEPIALIVPSDRIVPPRHLAALGAGSLTELTDLTELTAVSDPTEPVGPAARPPTGGWPLIDRLQLAPVRGPHEPVPAGLQPPARALLDRADRAPAPPVAASVRSARAIAVRPGVRAPSDANRSKISVTAPMIRRFPLAPIHDCSTRPFAGNC